MAICNTCNTEQKHIRTTFRGNAVIDECPNCNPEGFREKFKSIRDGEIVMGWEYDPSGYTWKDGLPQLTDSRLQDMHDIAAKPYEETDDYKDAVAKKRAKRRTSPLTPEEINKVVTQFQ